MSKLVIEIQSNAAVRTQSGTSRKGNPYSMNKQEGWLHNGVDPYPTKMSITLQQNATPYAPGLYELNYSDSVKVNQYGDLEFGRLVLLPARKPEQLTKAV